MLTIYDYFGFLSSEPEPYKFMTKSSTVRQSETSEVGALRVVWLLTLGNKKKEIERQVYTLMTLMGDVGGFNSAIILIPSFIMTFYSNRMYN